MSIENFDSLSIEEVEEMCDNIASLLESIGNDKALEILSKLQDVKSEVITVLGDADINTF